MRRFKAFIVCAFALALSLFTVNAFAEPSGSGDVYSGDFSGVGSADTSLDTNVDGAVVDREDNIAIEGLINGGSLLNGLVVTFEGEVIGNALDAGEGYKWVTLYDDDATIAVYMTEKDAEAITHHGNYSTQGDRLRIVGTFYLDCPHHQGDVDVHASKVAIVSNGYEVAHEVDRKKLIFGCSILGVSAIMAIAYWRLRERLR